MELLFIEKSGQNTAFFGTLSPNKRTFGLFLRKKSENIMRFEIHETIVNTVLLTLSFNLSP